MWSLGKTIKSAKPMMEWRVRVVSNDNVFARYNLTQGRDVWDDASGERSHEVSIVVRDDSLQSRDGSLGGTL